MAFDAAEFKSAPVVGVKISLADADRLLANQICYATQLLAAGIQYERRASIEDDSLVLTWVPVARRT